MTFLDVLFVLLFSILYAIWLGTYHLKRKNAFFSIFLILTVFHDYIFIHVGYVTTETVAYLIKSWQEYLFIYLLLILLMKSWRSVKKSTLTISLSILILTVWGIFVGVIRHHAPLEIYLGWRAYILPFALCLLLYLNDAFKGFEIKSFWKMVICLGLVSLVGGLCQWILFSKHDLSITMQSPNFLEQGQKILKDFWFFDKFGALHMLRSWPNFVRNNSLRVTSFFVSPIAFAEFLAIPTILLLAKMVYLEKGFSKMNDLLILILLLAGSYFSNARIGILVLMLSFIVLLLLASGKFRSDILWTMVSGVVLFTICALGLFGVGGESAQGRLRQYREMIDNVSFRGYGFGSEFATAYYDSLYISVILLFGLASILYFYVHLYVVQRIYRPAKKGEVRNWEGLLSLSATTIALSFSFAFVFQYSLTSSTTLLIYFIFFLTLSKKIPAYEIRGDQSKT
jgi:hypothetical protein